MGLAGVSIPQLMIILVIVVMIFGTKRMKTLGGDLGTAIRSFRKAVNSPEVFADDDEADKDRVTDSSSKQSKPAESRRSGPRSART